jgi:hypothetical protein
MYYGLELAYATVPTGESMLCMDVEWMTPGSTLSKYIFEM